MMELSEYTQMDGTALAESIRKGELTRGEVIDAAMRAIDQVNSELNALAGPLFDPPLDANDDGPFAGVPFAVKDLGLRVEGVQPRGACPMLVDTAPADADTALMKRFRKAGLRTVALTTTPELGFNSNTVSRMMGRTRNPWDPDRSAGGSSGGSSALVAARALPIAHANDGGGSIRIPAAYCGLVGLKPSRGRITTAPDHGDWILGMAIEFVVTRSVRDTAGLLDAVHGPEIGERFVLSGPPTSYASVAKEGLRDRRLRVAVLDHRYDGSPVADANRDGVRKVAQQLESMGHHVEYDSPVFEQRPYDEAALKAWSTYLTFLVDDIARQEGVAPSPEVLSHATIACADYGRTIPAADIHEIEMLYNKITRDVGQFLTQYDVLITPTTAYPNIPVDQIDQDDASHTAHTWYESVFEPCPFTQLFNVTGNPAITLPLAISQEGWPVGIQFAAPYLDESTLIALAGDLERAMPWADRRPTVCAG
jgi:amidase